MYMKHKLIFHTITIKYFNFRDIIPLKYVAGRCALNSTLLIHITLPSTSYNKLLNI